MKHFRPKHLRGVIAVASTLVSSLVASGAYAQESPDQPANQSSNTATATTVKALPEKSSEIQSVIVTAQKRKEDVNKVPISISVIGGDQLAAQHIGDYADITRSIPNISFSGGGGGGDAGDGPGLSNIEIRGVSSTAGSATVGIYVDDISLTVANAYSMGSAEPKFFDLDRVEVLRGPQGTLYGASSMGGTLKFITNQPNLKEQETNFYSEVSTIKGGEAGYTANLVFNEPLILNELALRFGVQGGHQGGYINQVSDTGSVTNYGINWQDDSVIRMALKWTPTKDLSITPAVFYQKVSTGDTDVSYSQILLSGEATGIPLKDYETNKHVREPGVDKLLVPSLTVNYGMDVGDLTAVSSYFKRDFNRVQDGSFINSVQLSGYIIDNPSLSAAIKALPAEVQLQNEIGQFSQEIRLASKPYDLAVSPVTWLVGAYYANEHTTITESDPIMGVNTTFANFGVSPTDPAVLANALPIGFPGDTSYHGIYSYHNTQESIFGELNYYFMPTLHATLGMRYLHADAEFANVQSLYYNGGTTANSSGTSGSKSTPKLSLIWEATPTDTLFATAAEGFRVGGTNPPIPQGLCQMLKPNPLSYDADSLWSYELGDKSRFFNNRLALNASLFYVKWKNMQQDIVLTCDFDYDVNVGDATSYGAEIELKVKPISSVLISLAGGMTHATLDNSDGANAGVVGAVAGSAIPGVPNFNVALTGQYDFNLSDDYYGFVRGAVHWTGASHGGFSTLPSGQANPDFNRPEYDTVDASTGLNWDKWEVSLFVKNLLNNNMVIQRPIVQSTLGEIYRIEPRTIGISLSAKF